MTSPYLYAGATISSCGAYRYRLWREWRLHPQPAQWAMWADEDGAPVVDGAGAQLGEPLSCVFVMLNPSTADGTQDDPTIRRCVNFARREGFDRLEVVNLFAYRATKPAVMFNASPDVDIIGPENQRHIEEALDLAGLIICAWGAHGDHSLQGNFVLGWIEDANYRAAPICCLGTTKDGHPRHPLYVPGNAPLVPFRGQGTLS